MVTDDVSPSTCVNAMDSGQVETALSENVRLDELGRTCPLEKTLHMLTPNAAAEALATT